MASYWGRSLHMSLYGESHGGGLGVVLDGLPPGEPLDEAALRAQMTRRAPGQHDWATPRREADLPEILSGYYRGRTTGTPLSAMIRNSDTRSRDYEQHETRPRPGHADLTGLLRYEGAGDPRGGGHFSGRVTSPLCFAGGVALQILRRRGVEVYAHIARIGAVEDTAVDPARPDMAALATVAARAFPVIDEAAGRRMVELIQAAKAEEDSVGGVIEVVATGLPAGIGDPMMGGIEPQIASLLFAVPAVKGLEFGAGFAATLRRGSENNDAMGIETAADGTRRVRHLTNHAGGADGGIANGMPIVCRVAIKPTSSIGKPQASVDLEQLTEEELLVVGRHDPCIVPRVVPVLEGAVALVLLDAWLASGRFREATLSD